MLQENQVPKIKYKKLCKIIVKIETFKISGQFVFGKCL